MNYIFDKKNSYIKGVLGSETPQASPAHMYTSLDTTGMLCRHDAKCRWAWAPRLRCCAGIVSGRWTRLWTRQWTHQWTCRWTPNDHPKGVSNHTPAHLPPVSKPASCTVFWREYFFDLKIWEQLQLLWFLHNFALWMILQGLMRQNFNPLTFSHVSFYIPPISSSIFRNLKICLIKPCKDPKYDLSWRDTIFFLKWWVVMLDNLWIMNEWPFLKDASTATDY